ncbi:MULTISPECIES: AAA family ATPase [Cyanophyceae]|uniref:AAA family ATPase n=1 Tax=Cyanophyceae TaxID=3028117 RepID=UPI0016838417|nr:AAA family ATPase [Trichocoleus sp. FACHB-40]MBD2007172.1 AAA family ATPase [Trichocoleus sp. FACHB-40]
MLKIPGYKIIEVLHEGTKSLVYRAFRQVDRQKVVIKILNQEYPDLNDIAKFKHQYEIVKNLDLSGIVKPYKLKNHNNTCVLVLEDFGGESLEKAINSSKMNLLELLKIAIQISQWLGKLHQNHIIHKDIKPQNILVNPHTGQVKIIDFGISSLLSRETQEIRNPNVLEGSLPYMSPEQTGRMNRAIDYRTDFYSLGVTFYQILTGALPFQSTDPMELVHCHIAKQPVPPSHLNPEIPLAISNIVMKLLSKTAEARYQSSYGLKFDLEVCLTQLQTTGKIENFIPGKQDFSNKFEIPQKLYGREQEITILLAAFERVSQGLTEMMLVSGFSGIGKSALINEIHKPIVQQRGYFISGKFDQFQRNIPYASLIQAFQSLISQILTESQEKIAAWREKLLNDLGANSQVIVDVIPEVELIVGQQPPVAQLGSTESQNRFNIVFQQFIRVFAKKEHPLVVFLDDLQWADSASLNLIQLLMTARDSRYLFLIGAYRDNEVNASHLLMMTLDEINSANAIVNHINLKPLDLGHTNQLISETLSCDEVESKPLAELVIRKTNGNPFFVNQFLKSLYEEKLLNFVPSQSVLNKRAQAVWQWNLEEIKKVGITDNVVELMAGKIQKLSDNTQQILKLAACIGNKFDLKVLSFVYENSPAATAIDLWEAIREELVLPLDNNYKIFLDFDAQEANNYLVSTDTLVSYKFLHDRVQQAAYSLIPEENKQDFHLKIGQLLLGNTSLEERESKIFDIVNQLNFGSELIVNQEARNKLAELNLTAGKKAKASIAYEPALKYLTTGMRLLATDSWESDYQLTFDLYKERSECEYLCKNFEQADKLFNTLLQNAKTNLEKAEIYGIQIISYTTLGKFSEVVELGKQALKLLGWNVPEKTREIKKALKLEIQDIRSSIGDTSIKDLIHSPDMTDLNMLATINLISHVIPALYYTNMDLSDLFYLKQASLSLRYGNAGNSAMGYLGLSRFLGERLGDFQSRYEFGKLSLNIIEKFNSSELKCKVNFLFGGFVNHWTKHSKIDIIHLKTAYQAGIESGDIVWACYANNVLSMRSFITGDYLDNLYIENQKSLDYANQVGEIYTPNFFLVTQQLTLCLKGLTKDKCSFSNEFYDEEKHLEQLRAYAGLAIALNWYYFVKLATLYIFEDYSNALKMALESEKTLSAVSGLMQVAEHYFYYSLTLAALYSTANEGQKKEYWKTLKKNQKQMKVWADNCPENFLHKYLLIAAEMARISGKTQEAMELYEQAIKSAKENEYIQNQAIANELAAKFYFDKGFDIIAKAYLMEARYGYTKWGATGKVKELNTNYPNLLYRATGVKATSTTYSIATSSEDAGVLDLNTVVKASQALSGEIILDKLLAKLMKIVIENAGAEKGFLIIKNKDNLLIQAEGAVNKDEVILLQSLPVENSGKLSVGIVNYVARTQDNLVLKDAVREGKFINEQYIVENKPKSILCTPLINQGKLIGILYLENNLTEGAFTSERLEVLNLLSSQAAISIENASLYTNLSALNIAYERFVPHEFLRFLEKESILDVQLGDQVFKEMTILFSDIRSFTTISEGMSPKENFNFINSYLSRVGPVIRQHNGFIDKYIGDAVMALFPQTSEDAVLAAIAMQKKVALWNEERQQRAEVPISIGIGLHTGSLMLGTVGESERMESTVISDAVNLASRMEGLTKLYGVGIAISEQALYQLDELSKYSYRFLDRVRVKGKQAPVAVFEVFSGEPESIRNLKTQTRTDFEQGIILYYQQKFAQAEQIFKEVLQKNHQDKAAKLYVKRCQKYQTSGVPAGWDGSEALDEK